MSEDAVGVGPPPELEVDASTGEPPAASDDALPSMTPQFNISPTLDGAGFAAFDEAEAARQEAEAARSSRPLGSAARGQARESQRETESGDVETAEVPSAERRDEGVPTDAVTQESSQLQVELSLEDSTSPAGAGMEAASPGIDVTVTLKKLADLKQKHTAVWNAGISIAQIPESLKMLDSATLDNLDQQTQINGQALGAVKSILDLGHVGTSESSPELSNQRNVQVLRRQLKRVAVLNRGTRPKANRNGQFFGSKVDEDKDEDEAEDEEIEGPHRAPRIAHSLLHGKPAHIPAMYAAEGLDAFSRSSMAELSTTKGATEEKKQVDDVLREEFVRVCEGILETPPLSRSTEKLRQVCTLAKANSFTIGGSDVPEFIALECWRYVTLQRIPSSFTLMKQGDDASFMCFVLEGLIDVFVNEVYSNTCGFGTAIGELALMQDPVGKRSATLIARGPCMVARLDFVHYHRILKTEHEAANDKRNRLLAQFPLFRDWPAASLLRVSRFLEYKEYKRGDAVLLQGLKNTKIFIVATGLVGIVIHIVPKTEVEQKVADRWLKVTRTKQSEDETRSAPTQKMARRMERRTTVEVGRLGPGHHFSNVKRSAEDPRKLTVRWDQKTREKHANGLSELAAALRAGDRAPFTVVCHTDCVLYRMDMAKMQELQTTDISLLRSFYETSPQVPDSSYIRDLIHQQISWKQYKGDLINDIVESRARRNVHGDMIAGESLVSRRSRGGKFSSRNLSPTTEQNASPISELAAIGPTRGPSRNISQPPTKTSLLREFRAAQQRLSSTSLPEINWSSNQSISMAQPQGQGYLPDELSTNLARSGRVGSSVSIAAVTAKGGRHEAQLSRSAVSYRRWMRTKERAAKRGASVRVPTPKLVPSLANILPFSLLSALCLCFVRCVCLCLAICLR